MKFTILTLPQVNWWQFIEEHEKVLGYSPTRILDGLGIRPEKDPLAFLLTIPTSTSEIPPSLDKLKKARVTGLLEHFHISILLSCTLSEYPSTLADFTMLQVRTVSTDEESLSVITGNLSVWLDAIERCSQLHCTKRLQTFALQAKNFFHSTFNNFDKL